MKLLQDFCQIFCCCSKLKEKTYGYLFEKLQPVSVQFNMLSSVLHIYFYIRPQRNYCANTKYQQIVLLCRTLEHYLFKQKKSLKEQCNSKIRPLLPFVILKELLLRFLLQMQGQIHGRPCLPLKKEASASHLS